MTAPQRNQGSQDGQHQRQVVLVALDGSPSAATALPVARLAAERLGAALEILHVASTDLSDADLADLRRRLGLDAAGLRGAAVRLLIGEPAGNTNQSRWRLSARFRSCFSRVVSILHTIWKGAL